jgi:hypothetical protein
MWTVTSNLTLSAPVPAQEGPEKDLLPEILESYRERWDPCDLDLLEHYMG